jgi:hypothetical protein
MYRTVESARQGDATAAGELLARGVDYELVYREAADGTSLGYLATADEVAGSVTLFASPLSAPVTGQILNVNAGLSALIPCAPWRLRRNWVCTRLTCKPTRQTPGRAPGWRCRATTGRGRS